MSGKRATQHMHVRLASIHSRSSIEGGRGQRLPHPDHLQDGGMRFHPQLIPIIKIGVFTRLNAGSKTRG